MFEGDLVEGELEIGQVAATIENIPSVKEIMNDLFSDFQQARLELVEGANFFILNMIQFQRYKLDNGLQVLIYPDHSTPMVALDVCYHVGAKNEDPNRTGFAHLFEHLMFGGSKNIPDYDLPLQLAGGENNAYTTNDLTNYYLTLPKANLETGVLVRI